MKSSVVVYSLLLFLISGGFLLFGQPVDSTTQNTLYGLMKDIQAKAQDYAAANPEDFRQEASKMADQQLDRILAASKSESSSERSLAASLLSIASPSAEGTNRLIALAYDVVPDVRYGALLGLATVTDGTNKHANEAIIKALSEVGNQSITRDAAFAASELKLIDALPEIKRLLESEDSLDKQYGIKAAGRYGVIASPLLPILQHQSASSSDPIFKAMFDKAISSIENPSENVFDTTRTPNEPVTKFPPSVDDQKPHGEVMRDSKKINLHEAINGLDIKKALAIFTLIIALVCVASWLIRRKLKT